MIIGICWDKDDRRWYVTMREVGTPQTAGICAFKNMAGRKGFEARADAFDFAATLVGFNSAPAA